MADRTSLLPPVGRRLRHLAARRVHALRRGERELPRYFVVGAKRAGTTSIDEYVVDHPLVLRGLVEKGCRYYDVNYHRGEAWFRGHLPLSADVDRLEARLGARPIVGESSPYYSFHPLAPARIAADVPGARLLFVIRDPVERAWSHYRYEVARGFETLPPVAALEAEEARLAVPDERQRWYAHRHFSYAGRSRYAAALDLLHGSFDASQVLVVRSEELFAQPAAVMAGVFAHLGLPPHVGAGYAAHKALKPDVVPPDFAELLRSLVSEDAERLPAMLAR